MTCTKGDEVGRGSRHPQGRPGRLDPSPASPNTVSNGGNAALVSVSSWNGLPLIPGVLHASPANAQRAFIVHPARLGAPIESKSRGPDFAVITWAYG